MGAPDPQSVMRLRIRRPSHEEINEACGEEAANEAFYFFQRHRKWGRNPSVAQKRAAYSQPLLLVQESLFMHYDANNSSLVMGAVTDERQSGYLDAGDSDARAVEGSIVEAMDDGVGPVKSA